MIYTDVRPDGQTAIKVQLTALDPGITITAAQPMHISITSLRNDSSCVLPVSSYMALAASCKQLLARAHNMPGQAVFCDSETFISHKPSGYVELKTRSTTRTGVLLVDAELLSLGHNPHYVITAAQQATGVRLIMCG